MKKLYVFFACVLLLLYTACDDFDAGLDKYPAVEEQPNEDIIMPEDEGIDNGYIEDEYLPVDTILEVENPYFVQAATWPGMPGDHELEPRLANVRVRISALYVFPTGRGGMNITTKPWFSTGLYAAPAEYIIIKKPEALRGKRVIVRIGASHCVLQEKHQPWKRAPKTFVTKVLNDDITHVLNYFGGNIYIIPDHPFDKPQIFEITGAMKSPDFILGKTDAVKWKEEIRKTTIPFAELIGRKHIWTMPTGANYLGRTDDPVALMEYYDETVDQDYNEFNGLSASSFDMRHRAPSYQHRHVPDIQLCAGSAHSGYPAMYGLYYASAGVNLNDMSTTNNAWGFYHELGHNYQNCWWMWSTLGEVSCNFHIAHARTRTLGVWHEGPVEQFERTKGFLMSDDPNKDLGEIGDLKARMLPFMQLAQQYGWRVYAYMSTKGRNLESRYASIMRGSSMSARRDFFCISASEYAGVNLSPFFDAWGIKRTDVAQKNLNDSLPLYAGEKFWEVWDGTIIPSFESHTPDVKDNYSYGLEVGELDRTNWLVLDSVNFLDSDANQIAKNMFDGKISTACQTSSGSRPMVDSEERPVMEVDMSGSHLVNHITFAHYNFNNGSKKRSVERFQLEYKEESGHVADGVDWISLGEFTTRNIGGIQNILLPKEVLMGRFRLTILKAFNYEPSVGTLYIAEFGLGYEEEIQPDPEPEPKPYLLDVIDLCNYSDADKARFYEVGALKSFEIYTESSGSQFAWVNYNDEKDKYLEFVLTEYNEKREATVFEQGKYMLKISFRAYLNGKHNIYFNGQLVKEKFDAGNKTNVLLDIGEVNIGPNDDGIATIKIVHAEGNNKRLVLGAVSLVKL